MRADPNKATSVWEPVPASHPLRNPIDGKMQFAKFAPFAPGPVSRSSPLENRCKWGLSCIIQVWVTRYPAIIANNPGTDNLRPPPAHRTASNVSFMLITPFLDWDPCVWRALSLIFGRGRTGAECDGSGSNLAAKWRSEGKWRKVNWKIIDLCVIIWILNWVRLGSWSGREKYTVRDFEEVTSLLLFQVGFKIRRCDS